MLNAYASSGPNLLSWSNAGGLTVITGILFRNYINQYPATNSSVKNAQGTDITSYYGGHTIKGHLGNSKKIPLQNNILSATVTEEFVAGYWFI